MGRTWSSGAHLEGEAGLDALGNDLRKDPIEGCADLHGELWLDRVFANELVERILEGTTETERNLSQWSPRLRVDLRSLYLELR